ncbi:hypothetical protein, partial [Specibacter sp. NPDC078692]|uniref:hypothetical protein n=1 Tax=Specibacter sp. NPDC078692 TaxID=3155818 RepID=UPI00343BF540
MGIFGKTRDTRPGPGWYPTDQDDVVAYFDGSNWSGRARLSALDDQCPIPLGAEAQAAQALATMRSNIDVASNELSRASSELEVFKRGAATAMAQLDIQIANLKSEHRDEASNGLSRASSELEVFKRGAATAMAQLDIQIANLKSE